MVRRRDVATRSELTGYILNAKESRREDPNETVLIAEFLNGTTINEVVAPQTNPEPIPTEDKEKQLPSWTTLFKYNLSGENGMALS
ncbi:hypothetical protein HAX54_038780 [Datura stramonium]|uniref:Uncharacterized protein n=1 Tax=Datura stramonium TaxID=4076 RepID=A0ABS8SI84_DATST|nr:hypothetical protein [Datura stramonium]